MNTTFLRKLGLKKKNDGTSTGLKSTNSGEYIASYSPVDGAHIGDVSVTTPKEYEKTVRTAQRAYAKWKMVPAPKRGDIVRQYGEALRANKENLGKLVSYEMGKSLQEGYGEVQEMIDICDFAVGLSRQLYGLTMHSERPLHRMYGDVTRWKGSEKTPLCSIACQNLLQDVLKANKVPEGVSSVVTGDYEIGQLMTTDRRLPLISATGSSRMGKIVGATVAERLGRSLLELGGNNAIIVTPNADMKLLLTAAVFGAVGTCGQRCTTTRRLIVHEDVYESVKTAIKKAYRQIKIGSPLDAKMHVGPLIDTHAVATYAEALKAAKAQGAVSVVPGRVLKGAGYESGCYVKPAVFEAENSMDIVQTETFAPILYLIKYSGDLDNAIAIQNDVPQGLSSAIMTTNMREAELFLSQAGSDCGIANVNIGTSGAEIGGAFGGEKETGGGRESGSDSWKAYMRRQTNTINYSSEVPLAQGIKFNLK